MMWYYEQKNFAGVWVPKLSLDMPQEKTLSGKIKIRHVKLLPACFDGMEFTASTLECLNAIRQMFLPDGPDEPEMAEIPEPDPKPAPADGARLVMYARDIDGTGSMHACSKEDPGAIQFVSAQFAGDMVEAGILTPELMQEILT